MDETTNTDGARIPVIGSYTVRVVIRGDEDAKAPTGADIEEAVQGAALGLIKSGQATVTAIAERTDR